MLFVFQDLSCLRIHKNDTTLKLTIIIHASILGLRIHKNDTTLKHNGVYTDYLDSLRIHKNDTTLKPTNAEETGKLYNV